MKYFFILGFTIISLYTFANLASASQYSNSELHYSFEVPSEWEEIPQDEIDNQTKVANGITTHESIYFRKGYYLKDSNSSEPPYILVQEKSGYAVFDKVAELYKAGGTEKIAEKVTQKSDLLNDANYGNVRIDNDRKIIFARMDVEKKNKSVIRGLQAIFFGSNSQVSLNFYALDSEFSKYESDFNLMIDSFSYDSDYVYADKNPIFNGVLSKGLSGGIIGGIFGLIIFIISRGKKKEFSVNKVVNNKKKIYINKKIVMATILIALFITVPVLFIYKYSNEEKDKADEPIDNSIISEFNEWDEYYLDNDKYKIMFPSRPTEIDGEIIIFGKLIPYTKYSSSINNSSFSSIFFHSENLYDMFNKNIKERYDSEDFSGYREFILSHNVSPWEPLLYIYDILFKENTGYREIEKINNHFFDHNTIDYVWKNSDAENFIKGKIIAVDSKDIYILTSENSQNDFRDYEKFVYSWKPFGDLSE